MGRILFTHANLLDGEHPARPESAIAVEGNRIGAVTSGPVAPKPGDTVIDCGGRTVMPGMVSGHFHATYRGLQSPVSDPYTRPLGLEHPPAYQAYVAADNARIALQAGVTSVVGASGPADIDPSLRDAINDGLLVGPRVVPASRNLITTAYSIGEKPWWFESAAWGGLRLCDGPDEFRRTVRDEIRRGAEIVKLFASEGHGWRSPAQTPCITQAELNAAVEAAHGLGKRARAHVAAKDAILACLEAGVDVIDHGDGLDDECIKLMADAGTFLVPSLHIFAGKFTEFQNAGPAGRPMPQYLREFRALCEILPDAVKAGVRVCLGDDYGGLTFPHGEYGKEPAVCVDMVGITPLEALRWATVNGGALVGLDDLGRVAEGALADIIVVDGDPSVDIGVLGEIENIRVVMRDGQVYVNNIA